ncbi:MAG TPA: Ltp family lipoprotein [Candidatus Pelethocola excrementipullorum]|nr:Ltp family lipoprotein [Candidatus Pelethocola excrementipullorum]
MKNTEGTSAFSVSNGTLNGKSSRNFNYTLTLENITTKVSGYTFPALSGVAHIMWGQEEKDSDDYTSIFNEILNSLQYEVNPPSTTVAPTAEPTPSVEPEPSATPSTEEPGITMSQRNALSKAHDYLDYTAFSYSGLIGQLEYEGFSTEDSTYAVDNCGADWNEQAAQKAQDYLDYSSFSRTGLIEQLEYEGFTAEQAEYGVSAVGY